MTFSICTREPYVDTGDDDQHRLGVVVTIRLPGIGALCPFAAEHGAVATQALTDVGLGGKDIDYLKDSLVVDNVLQALLNADGGRAERQPHDVGSETTFAFTDDSYLSQAGHREGDAYIVAGNLLTGEAVVDVTANAHERIADGDEPLVKWLIDAFGSGHATGDDKYDDFAIQSVAVIVTSAEDREMEPYYNDPRTDATGTPLRDLQGTFSMAREECEAALEKYAEAQSGEAHVDPETTAVGLDREFGEVVADVVDGSDGLAGVTDEVGPAFEYTTHSEHLIVGPLCNDYQIARLGGLVGSGDTGAYRVGPVGDERDYASANRDGVRRRRGLVRALGRKKRLVVDMYNHRLTVDKGNLVVGVRKFDRLERVTSKGDTGE